MTTVERVAAEEPEVSPQEPVGTKTGAERRGLTGRGFIGSRSRDDHVEEAAVQCSHHVLTVTEGRSPHPDGLFYFRAAATAFLCRGYISFLLAL